MVFAPENQVRIGLPAGGKEIRTLGPPSEGLRFFETPLSNSTRKRCSQGQQFRQSPAAKNVKISHEGRSRRRRAFYCDCGVLIAIRYFSTAPVHRLGYPVSLWPLPPGTANSKNSPMPPAFSKASKCERLCSIE